MLVWQAVIIFWMRLLQVGWSQRMCRAPGQLLQVSVNNLQMTYSTNVARSQTSVSVALKLHASWNVSIPSGFFIDGFLVQLINPSDGQTLDPLNECISGSAALWINQGNCSNENMLNPICPSRVLNSTLQNCVCPVNNCSLLGTDNCIGSPFWLSQGYFAVQNDVRNIEAFVDFHTNYQITIRPYYRKYTSFARQLVTKGATNCHQLVAASNNLTEKESIQLCCDLGIPHFDPLDMKISGIKPNFSSGMAEIIIMWLPPVFQEEITFELLVLPSKFLTQQPMTKAVETITPAEIPSYLRIACYNSTYGYKSIVTNLLIDADYNIIVISKYPSETQRRYCNDNTRCRSSLPLNFPNISLCENGASPCNPNYDCLRILNELGQFNYTCQYNPIPKTSTSLPATFTNEIGVGQCDDRNNTCDENYICISTENALGETSFACRFNSGMVVAPSTSFLQIGVVLLFNIVSCMLIL